MCFYRYIRTRFIIITILFIIIIIQHLYRAMYLTSLVMQRHTSISISHLSVVSWVGLTFFIMLNQLSLSDAHSGRMLFFFMSSFNRSIHLSSGLQLWRDPSIRVFRTYFATLSSSLRCTCPNDDSRFFMRKVLIGFM